MNILHHAKPDSGVLDPHFLHPLSPVGVSQYKRLLSENLTARSACKPRCGRPKAVNLDRMQRERSGQDQRQQKDKAHYGNAGPDCFHARHGRQRFAED
jgi:hypothetical protein